MFAYIQNAIIVRGRRHELASLALSALAALICLYVKQTDDTMKYSMAYSAFCGYGLIYALEDSHFGVTRRLKTAKSRKNHQRKWLKSIVQDYALCHFSWQARSNRPSIRFKIDSGYACLYAGITGLLCLLIDRETVSLHASSCVLTITTCGFMLFRGTNFSIRRIERRWQEWQDQDYIDHDIVASLSRILWSWSNRNNHATSPSIVLQIYPATVACKNSLETVSILPEANLKLTAATNDGSAVSYFKAVHEVCAAALDVRLIGVFSPSSREPVEIGTMSSSTFDKIWQGTKLNKRPHAWIRTDPSHGHKCVHLFLISQSTV